MNWKSHLLTFVLLFLVVVLFAQTCRPRRPSGAVPPPDARFVTLTLEGRPERLTGLSYEVRAEVADTQEKRQRGLSGRAGLEPGYGMLYVYDEPQQPKFSQAATRFPLSAAFLRDDGTVAEIRDTQAGDPSVIQPAEPVRYVLEVRAGWFEDRGVGRGSRFQLPDDLTAPPAAPVEPADAAAEAATADPAAAAAAAPTPAPQG